MNKICKICEEDKNISNFHKKKSGKFGVTAICKDCRKINELEYNNKYKDILKERYWGDVNKSREKARIKYRDNSEVCKERAKRYYKNNPEKYKENNKKYLKTDRGAELNRIKSSNRRGKIKTTSDGTININSTLELLSIQDNLCNYCGINISNRKIRHLDHIHPISRGGIHSINNVQWLCSDCNFSKGTNIIVG